MHLLQEDIDLFFKLHPALLQYVNKKLGIMTRIRTPQALKDSGVENVARVREELWKRRRIMDEFVSENLFAFSDDELAIVESWKNAVVGSFYVVRHLKKYTVFVTTEGHPIAYGVSSLNSPLREMFPHLPVYVEAALIPFKKRITYDGIIIPSPVIFGQGYEFDIEERYCEAKKLPGIVSTLNSTLSAI